MLQTINYKVKIKNIIQTLTKWSKKPSLDHELSGILHEYHSLVNDGMINFTDAAVIINACTHILEKRIDLLSKEFYSLSMRLCSALKRPEEEAPKESETDTTTEHPTEDLSKKAESVKEILNTKQNKKEDDKKKEKPPDKNKRNKKNNKETVADTSKKISIPGLPDEILESLNLTDCNINDVIRECLSKLTPAHPLYSVFAKIGDEISRTKNLITYNDISLSGKSWNILYILENLLKKNNPESEIPESNITTTENIINDSAIASEINISSSDAVENTLTCTQISENGVENITDMYEDINSEEITQNDSSINGNTSTSQSENSQSITCDNNTNIDADSRCSIVETSAETNSENLNTESSKKRLSDAELVKIVADRCKITLKDVKINLLRVPDRVLLKIDYFRLSSEFFTKTKKKKAEQKIKNLVKPKVITRKRQKEMDAECIELVKKLKSYDLDAFEDFCHTYNVSQGLCSPIPEKLCSSRKSIDNRSEMSYGCPVTPDSGRFSMSFLTDSEFEHTDLDLDQDSDNRRTLSRADSGCCLMSPPHESNIDSALPFSSEPVPEAEPQDPTLLKLKEMFPNSFADPQRAELLKSIVRPPEKQGDTENYLDWKKFIDDKTAKDVEFNIHEYGSEILNTFPTKTKNEVISFNSVVKNKSVGDVARYFVSALQLANTYNVEVCDERKGEVKTKGFNLKFLNDERPHEEFEELNLPSESQFFESLASTSSTSANNRHSTPYTSQQNPRQNQPSYHKAKRRRIDYTC